MTEQFAQDYFAADYFAADYLVSEQGQAEQGSGGGDPEGVAGGFFRFPDQPTETLADRIVSAPVETAEPPGSTEEQLRRNDLEQIEIEKGRLLSRADMLRRVGIEIGSELEADISNEELVFMLLLIDE